MADEYFNLGDTKTITIDGYGDFEMEIVAFDADEKVDGTKAGVTWLSKDLIAPHIMNSTNTNTGDWEASEMRSWLKSDIYTALPTEVQSAIVTVKKTYYDYSSINTLTCEDNVWIPSHREMFGSNSYETSGAMYTSYFTSDVSRIKNYSGRAAGWWLRSTDLSDIFRTVNGVGKSGSYSASINCGVALGFCM